MNTEENRELEQLLSDCKDLLGEQETASSQLSAEDIQIDYQKFYGEDAVQPEPPAPVRPLTAYEQSKPAYQTARRMAYEQEKEARRVAVTNKQPAQLPSANTGAYAQWLYEQGTGEETTAQRQQAQTMVAQMTEPAEKSRKRRKKGWLWIVLVLLLAAAAVMLITRQPAYDRTDRLPRTSTILLAGTDEGGLRTDTMILMRVSGSLREIDLVSIPRDTLVLGNYSVPKINSAYGYAGGGADGMEELFDRIEECIGFRPNGYMLVNLDSFAELVDAMGGVRYDVPMPMQYSDPSQDLEIDLQAGEQTLSGKEALQLVRYRSGYAAADLERVSVQRSFLQEAIRQWSSPLRAFRYPAALKVLMENVESDLSFGNYFWLFQTVLSCRDNIEMLTLPGTAMMIGGGSYYVLDKEAVAETVNTYLNPYETPVKESDLTIRNG